MYQHRQMRIRDMYSQANMTAVNLHRVSICTASTKSLKATKLPYSTDDSVTRHRQTKTEYAYAAMALVNVPGDQPAM